MTVNASSLSNHYGDLRSKHPQSPASDASAIFFNTPRHSHGFSNGSVTTAPTDPRSALQRRFTTESMHNAGTDLQTSTMFKVQALERKKQDYERLRESRARLDADLELLNRQTAQEETEIRQMMGGMQDLSLLQGAQSEPITPPYHGSAVGSYARTTSYSAQMMSPTSSNRMSRSGSLLDSQQSFHDPSGGTGIDKLPSKSVPTSRRGSSDRLAAYLAFDAKNAGTRVPQYPNSLANAARVPRGVNTGVLHNRTNTNSTAFLFDDDDDIPNSFQETPTSPQVKEYMNLHSIDDKFPILTTQVNGTLSASSTALDLSRIESAPTQEDPGSAWPTFNRSRPARQSLSHVPYDFAQSMPTSNRNSIQSLSSMPAAQSAVYGASRHSRAGSLASQLSETYQQTNHSTTPARPNLSSIQASSYSTNDIPTLKTANLLSQTNFSPPKNRADEHFHKHNVSLGRIPATAVNRRMSRDVPTYDAFREATSPTALRPVVSHGSSEAGNTINSPIPMRDSLSLADTLSQQTLTNHTFTPATYHGMYHGPNNNFNHSTNSSHRYSHSQNMPSFDAGHLPHTDPYDQSQGNASSFALASEDNAMLDELLQSNPAQIYGLCKDQHGCRYLQRLLDNRDPDTIDTIFQATKDHVVELMVDPFGNYLCQKLLEIANDEQRTQLVRNSAPSMVSIALNQHGTRALQKMVEFLSTPEQNNIIIDALKEKVVPLIQDLNGNHVIQKCLTRLKNNDAQFIYDTVGPSCVVVGTHRHGCCVIQRCIDHASDEQRSNLVGHIISNAYSLVQDPFGNYVLQYVLELKEPAFVTPLCQTFMGHLASLSKHKFSSNVMEKMIRNSEPEIRAALVEEMLQGQELEKMLRDNYANYVVQTAVDNLEPGLRQRLVDAIKPILPTLRQTPYARRLQVKIYGSESPLPNRAGAVFQDFPSQRLGNNNNDAMYQHHAPRHPAQFHSSNGSRSRQHQPMTGSSTRLQHAAMAPSFVPLSSTTNTNPDVQQIYPNYQMSSNSNVPPFY